MDTPSIHSIKKEISIDQLARLGAIKGQLENALKETHQKIVNLLRALSELCDLGLQVNGAQNIAELQATNHAKFGGRLSEVCSSAKQLLAELDVQVAPEASVEWLIKTLDEHIIIGQIKQGERELERNNEQLKSGETSEEIRLYLLDRNQQLIQWIETARAKLAS